MPWAPSGNIRGPAGPVYTAGLVTVAASGAAQTLDLASQPSDVRWRVTLTAASVALTITNPAPVQVVVVYVAQDATGGRVATWPASIKWDNGLVPVLSTTAGAVDRISLETLDGGTTWYGSAAGHFS